MDERHRNLVLALWSSRVDLRHLRLEDDRAELAALATWLLAVIDGKADPLARGRTP